MKTTVVQFFFKEYGTPYYGHAAINGIVDKKQGNVYYYSHSDNYNGAVRERGIREVLEGGYYEELTIYEVQ